MSQTLQAVFENGVLRPLEPVALYEREQVSVTLMRAGNEPWQDHFEYMEPDADDSIPIDEVRAALARIPGSMRDDFIRERDERF